jgi:5-methylcytosine-specific restriction protein A
MTDQIVRRQWDIPLQDATPTLILVRQRSDGSKTGLLHVQFINPAVGANAQLDILTNGFGPPEEMFAVPRSNHWHTVRKHYLEKFPTCAACGGTEMVEVHHCVPFHTHPELELDESNFITLCQAPGLSHHFVIGHCGTSWADWNPHVREDAALMLKRKRERVRG